MWRLCSFFPKQAQSYSMWVTVGCEGSVPSFPSRPSPTLCGLPLDVKVLFLLSQAGPVLLYVGYCWMWRLCSFFPKQARSYSMWVTVGCEGSVPSFPGRPSPTLCGLPLDVKALFLLSQVGPVLLYEGYCWMWGLCSFFPKQAQSYSMWVTVGCEGSVPSFPSRPGPTLCGLPLDVRALFLLSQAGPVLLYVGYRWMWGLCSFFPKQAQSYSMWVTVGCEGSVPSFPSRPSPTLCGLLLDVKVLFLLSQVGPVLLYVGYCWIWRLCSFFPKQAQSYSMWVTVGCEGSVPSFPSRPSPTLCGLPLDVKALFLLSQVGPVLLYVGYCWMWRLCSFFPKQAQSYSMWVTVGCEGSVPSFPSRPGPTLCGLLLDVRALFLLSQVGPVLLYVGYCWMWGLCSFFPK